MWNSKMAGRNTARCPVWLWPLVQNFSWRCQPSFSTGAILCSGMAVDRNVWSSRIRINLTVLLQSLWFKNTIVCQCLLMTPPQQSAFAKSRWLWMISCQGVQYITHCPRYKRSLVSFSASFSERNGIVMRISLVTILNKSSIIRLKVIIPTWIQRSCRQRKKFCNKFYLRTFTLILTRNGNSWKSSASYEPESLK